MPPVAIPAIPKETARSARAIFGPGNFYVRVGNELDCLLRDLSLELLVNGDEARDPGIPLLALVTLFQSHEELSDSQAVDALRSRLDWKYALHLPRAAPGLHAGDLCSFRQLLLHDPLCWQQFRRLGNRLGRLARPCAADTALLATTSSLLALCDYDRLQSLFDAMRALLEAVARGRPTWLSEVALPHWYMRYRALPPANAARGQAALAEAIGADARYLLDALDGEPAGPPLAEGAALERLWAAQFAVAASGELRFRPRCHDCGARPYPCRAVTRAGREAAGGQEEG